MINKVFLIGNLGRDPETKELASGNKVTNLSVATSENYRDKSREWQQLTEWHKVTCYGPLAEKAARLAKGQKIWIEGKLTTRKWEDKEGQKRYTTEVIPSYVRAISVTEGDSRTEWKPEPATNSSDALMKPRPNNSDDLPF